MDRSPRWSTASCRHHGPVSPAQRIREMEAGGFWITEARYQPSAVLEAHAHEQASLTFVLAGGFEEEIGRRRSELRPNALLVKPGSVDHRDLIGPAGASIIFVEPMPARAALIDDAVPVLRSVSLVRPPALARICGRLRQEIRRPDAGTGLAVESLLLEALSLVGRQRERGPIAGRPPQWLQRIRDALAEQLPDPPTITELATEAGVDPTYVARAFRRHFRMCPSEFVQQLRIDRAAAQLSSSDKPLAQIAADAGFSDQSHLGRVFRRYTGTTPAAFRRASGPVAADPPI